MLNKELSNELTLVLTTESDHQKAEELASSLLKKRLIACVSFMRIDSSYWWDGEIIRSKEVQLILKTKESLLNDLNNEIRRSHSYDTPEIIQLTANTSEDYMCWLNEMTL